MAFLWEQRCGEGTLGNVKGSQKSETAFQNNDELKKIPYSFVVVNNLTKLLPVMLKKGRFEWLFFG